MKTDNKPHSVTFSFTSNCCETVSAFEVCGNRLRCKVREEPVDQFLFGFLENGWVSRQRAGRGEACSRPQRVAVRSVSTVCSPWLPRTCWLELGACDETGTSFPHADSQKFFRHVRDFLHFVLSVFAKPQMRCLVTGERTQGVCIRQLAGALHSHA